MERHISEDCRACVRQFIYDMCNGTVQASGLLSDIDARLIVSDAGEASAAEQAVTIFLNVITTDDQGLVVNAADAEFRAAQWMRSYFDRSYEVEPPFEAWETERHYPHDYPHSGPMP